jgi:soluble lytic murein transglycosylase
MRKALLLSLALIGLPPAPTPSAAQGPALQATNHPRLPAALSDVWMVPAAAAPAGARADLATAVTLVGELKYEEALALLSRSAPQAGPLAPYATYYRGIAELGLERAAEAVQTFRRLAADAPLGYLGEASILRQADSHEALGEFAAALELYERLATAKSLDPIDVLMRIGRTAKASGDLEKARTAFARVYYEHPTSDPAEQADAELGLLADRPALTAGSDRYRLEMARGERLFSARRYADARAAFEALHAVARGDDRDLLTLRMAECNYSLKRARPARDALRPLIDQGPRRSEALFYYAASLRELGLRDAYVTSIRRLADEFPRDSWAEEGLNHLATSYIIGDEHEAADRTLRELFDRFPKGRYAERAAWKVGWLAYRSGQYAEAVRYFEGGASNFPRSDYRPAWLYWSARAYDALKQTDSAQARYALLFADYANTYYGRIGAPRLSPAARESVPSLRASFVPAAPRPAPPNRAVISELLAAQLYDEALNELRYAQLAWGDSPSIQATMGFVYNRQGDIRAGINAIKRAYPQYMTAYGEQLPAELWTLLYPLEHWPSIRRYAAEHGLDPYLIAALILQESNFDPVVRSSANAYGLMQLLPSTGRVYARRLKLTSRFSVSLLRDAEANLRMGTAYFADLMRRFDGPHQALAGYNAGPSRVVAWSAARPGAPRDEFIEDIPFPETQNYVKRVLGTAEDYRRLYPDAAGAVGDASVAGDGRQR